MYSLNTVFGLSNYNLKDYLKYINRFQIAQKQYALTKIHMVFDFRR